MENEFMPPKQLKTLEIDIEKKVFRINGQDFGRNCNAVSIVCVPPKWSFKVEITQPISFIGEYDLNGKEKDRTTLIRTVKKGKTD